MKELGPLPTWLCEVSITSSNSINPFPNNFSCYPECLEDIFPSVSSVIPVCRTETEFLLCSLAAALDLDVKISWNCSHNLIPKQDPCANWSGLSCDGSGQPVALDLSNIGLSGQCTTMITIAFMGSVGIAMLPAIIGDMRSVTALNLSHNALSGEF